MDKYEPTFTSSESSDGEDGEEEQKRPLQVTISPIPHSILIEPQEAHELLTCKPAPVTVSINSSVGNGDDNTGRKLKRRDTPRKVSFARGTKGKKKGWQTYSGILLTLACGLSYATVGLVVKYLKGYHALNLAFFRFAGMFLPSIPFLLYVICVKKQPVLHFVWPITDPAKMKVCGALFGRSFVGFVAVVLHFYAIHYLTVADAMTVGSCTPVFVTLVAHVFLGEKCGIFPIVAALLTITGVGIIARPPLLTGADKFDTDVLVGAAFAFGKMMFSSLAIVFLRYLRQVHVAFLLFITGLFSLLQNTTAALVLGVFDLTFDPSHVMYVVILALASFLGQLFLALALKCEEAGPFSILTSCDVIFAFVLQFIFLGTVPDVFSLVGATILVTAVCLTVFRKWVQSLPDDAEAKKKFWIVLK